MSSMEVTDYSELLQAIFLDMAKRDWPLEFNRLEAALAIMQEIAKDRRTNQIREEKHEPQPPTEKQLAFLKKHCGISDFKGTRNEASKIINAKIKEWG